MWVRFPPPAPNNTMPRAKETKWYRDRPKGGVCAYCWEVFTHLTMDHVIPLSKGGTWRRENIVFCCPDCNLKKGDMTVYEYLMYLYEKRKGNEERRVHCD